MYEQLEQIASQWLVIISQPIIIIPLLGGLAFGFLVSICPLIKYRKRKSDREFYVYTANSLGAGILFVSTQTTQPLDAVLSMLILVMASAVVVPWLFFRWYNK